MSAVPAAEEITAACAVRAARAVPAIRAIPGKESNMFDLWNLLLHFAGGSDKIELSE